MEVLSFVYNMHVKKEKTIELNKTQEHFLVLLI